MDNASKITREKFIIGLTGNIATGKSAVMQLAAQRGALTIDADRVVHEILNTDTAVQEAIAAAFGPIVLEDGSINRRVLGQIVFNDARSLKTLEAIVHPVVYQVVLQMLADTSAQIIMYEAIKLLESKFRAHCGQIWVTTCTKETQLERLQKYRGLDKETALMRIAAQTPQAEKIAQADVVIDTNGTLADTEAQFLTAWSNLPDFDS